MNNCALCFIKYEDVLNNIENIRDILSNEVFLFLYNSVEDELNRLFPEPFSDDQSLEEILKAAFDSDSYRERDALEDLISINSYPEIIYFTNSKNFCCVYSDFFEYELIKRTLENDDLILNGIYLLFREKEDIMELSVWEDSSETAAITWKIENKKIFCNINENQKLKKLLSISDAELNRLTDEKSFSEIKNNISDLFDFDVSHTFSYFKSHCKKYKENILNDAVRNVMGVSCASFYVFDADEDLIVHQLKKHNKPIQYSENYWKIANMIDETLFEHFGCHAKGSENPGKIIFYGSKGKRCFGVTSDIFNFENICDYVKKYFGDTLLTIVATAIFDDEVIGLFLFKGKKMIAEMVVNASDTNENQENIFSTKKRNPENIYKLFGVDAESLDCFTTDDFLSSYFALCKALDLPAEFKTQICYE